MSLKSRVRKLEKILGQRSMCSFCRNDYVQPICTYKETWGVRELVSGTPQRTCPACGRRGKKPFSEIVFAYTDTQDNVRDRLREELARMEEDIQEIGAPGGRNEPQKPEEAMKALRSVFAKLYIPDPFPEWTDARKYLARTYTLLDSLLHLSAPNPWSLTSVDAAAPSLLWDNFWAECDGGLPPSDGRGDREHP